MKNILIIIFAIILQSILIFCQTGQNDFPNLTGPYLGQEPPGMTPVLFAPEILVKEKQAHSNIVFSKEGTEAYWCHNGIWFSKVKNEKWTFPEMVPFSKTELSDDAPFLSPDGKQLFFTSKRPIQNSDTSKKENIWVVDVTKDSWSEARPLPTVINDKFQHWQVSVDNKGNLYFGHRFNDNPDQKSDIYFSSFRNGEYQKPEKLVVTINSPAHEINPFVSPNGDYLIFSRMKDRKPLDGGLFISFKMQDGTWSKASPLSDDIRFNFGGNCPMVTIDGKYLFFLDIFDDKWQCYWVSAEFIEDLKQKVMK